MPFALRQRSAPGRRIAQPFGRFTAVAQRGQAVTFQQTDPDIIGRHAVGTVVHLGQWQMWGRAGVLRHGRQNNRFQKCRQRKRRVFCVARLTFLNANRLSCLLVSARLGGRHPADLFAVYACGGGAMVPRKVNLKDKREARATLLHSQRHCACHQGRGSSGPKSLRRRDRSDRCD
jgi:hypothetical protein